MCYLKINNYKLAIEYLDKAACYASFDGNRLMEFYYQKLSLKLKKIFNTESNF